jgi:hypothetical protein
MFQLTIVAIIRQYYNIKKGETDKTKKEAFFLFTHFITLYAPMPWATLHTLMP